MADPVLGIGPNLNAYRAALQQPTQGREMAQVARGVAQTLNVAFNNVPMPLGSSPSRKERDILRLREAIEQMVLALSTAVKDGGFDGVAWPDAGTQNFVLPNQHTPKEQILDDVQLSARSRQLLEASPEALEAMANSLHPLEDLDTAKNMAWLAQAQVLHQAILAVSAQANINSRLATRILHLSQGQDIKNALNLRAQNLDWDGEKSVEQSDHDDGDDQA